MKTSAQFLPGPKQFLERVGPFLSQKEAEYSLHLGLTHFRISNPDASAKFFEVTQEKRVIGGGLFAKNLLLSAIGERGIDEVVSLLIRAQLNLEGMVAPTETAELFASKWAEKTHKRFELAMSQKIYRLEKAVFPEGVNGEVSLAQEHHTDLLAEWVLKFHEESLPHEPISSLDARNIVMKRISQKQVFVWTQNNEPFAMTFVGRPTENGISISVVYTPKHQRRKGYASALVAHASQKMLDEGKKFCVLYTDVANPTSNKIYRDIGYSEIATSKHFIFKE